MRLSYFIFSVICLSLSACGYMSDLKKRGVKGKAVVVGGYETSYNGGIIETPKDKYELGVVFYTKDGKKVQNHNKKVDYETFQLAYEGKEVDVIYLPDDPKTFEIISGKNVAYFMGFTPRNLVMDDLIKLFKDASLNKNLKTLSKIQYGWEDEEMYVKKRTQHKTDEVMLQNRDVFAKIHVIPQQYITYATARHNLCADWEEKENNAPKEITEAMWEKLPAFMHDFKGYYAWKEYYVFFKKRLERNYIQSINYQFIIMPKSKF